MDLVRAEIVEKMSENIEIVDVGVWDCRIKSFDGWILEIIGGISSSLDNAPRKIIRFKGVSYIDCPTEFMYPRIRKGNKLERQKIAMREDIDDGQELYVIEAETMGRPKPQSFFIVAEEMEIQDCR